MSVLVQTLNLTSRTLLQLLGLKFIYLFFYFFQNLNFFHLFQFFQREVYFFSYFEQNFLKLTKVKTNKKRLISPSSFFFLWPFSQETSSFFLKLLFFLSFLFLLLFVYVFVYSFLLVDSFWTVFYIFVFLFFFVVASFCALLPVLFFLFICFFSFFFFPISSNLFLILYLLLGLHLEQVHHLDFLHLETQITKRKVDKCFVVLASFLFSLFVQLIVENSKRKLSFLKKEPNKFHFEIKTKLKKRIINEWSKSISFFSIIHWLTYLVITKSSSSHLTWGEPNVKVKK